MFDYIYRIIYYLFIWDGGEVLTKEQKEEKKKEKLKEKVEVFKETIKTFEEDNNIE